jgi:hypothetical protein
MRHALTGFDATKNRVWLLVGQLALLIIAAITSFLLAGIWGFAASSLLKAFPRHPFLSTGILLSVCALLFLCIRGAQMTSFGGIYFLSRAVLLFVSTIAGVVSLELVFVGSSAFIDASVEDYLWLAGGLFLVALAAAGIKYAFSWRVSYWIMFLTVLSAVIFSIFGILIRTFVS